MKQFFIEYFSSHYELEAKLSQRPEITKISLIVEIINSLNLIQN